VKLQGLNNFLIIIKNQLAALRGEFIENFFFLSSSEIPKEYTDFASNTKLIIYTITVNRTEVISLLFGFFKIKNII